MHEGEEDSMRTDLVALAERNRCARTLADKDKAVTVLSFIACQIVTVVLFTFPALANTVALSGQY